MVTAAIYARISLDKEGTGAGVKRQIADCEAEAKRRGWTVAETYVDDDISAYSGKNRPSYQRMLEDLRDGSRGAVIVWHLDRLHRQPKELEQFVEVCERAGTKVATLHGDVDLGNGDGLLIARIMAAVAANESAAKGRRVSRKMQENAEQGRPHGGVRPFGFEDDRVTVRKSEAKIIDDLATRFLAGESLTSLVHWLNDEEIPTPGKATQWGTGTLRNILRSGRISGQREHRGDIIGSAQWPAIITPAQTDRIRSILDDPNRRTNRTARSYLLPGMLRCGRCGHLMSSQPRGGVRRYICRSTQGSTGCGHTYIAALPLEELIAEAVLYRLDTPELAAALSGRHRDDATTAALYDQVSEDQAQLEELSMLYANKSITAAEWMTARNPIETRLRDAKRTLARLSNTGDLARYIGQGQELRTQWTGLPLNRQRSIVQGVLDHAVVGPGTGNRFDPSRVRPVWKL